VYADRVLIADARQRCRKASLARREYIDRRISEYEMACRLSRGGDVNRSRYWEAKALDDKRELAAIAGRAVKEEALQ
jgi:hypothetical protein